MQRSTFLAALTVALAGSRGAARAEYNHDAPPASHPAVPGTIYQHPGYYPEFRGTFSPPIFMTTLNTPGIYGAYDFGNASLTLFNREPIFYPVRPGLPALTETVSPPVAAAPQTGTASVRVRVPGGARLLFQGQLVAGIGTERHFVTPPLVVGQRFRYNVQAVWTDGSGEVRRQQQVYVRAGETVAVEFAEAGPTLRTLPPPRPIRD